MNNINQNEVNIEYIFRLRSDFDIEVYKTTQFLITTLAAVQQFDLSSQNRFISNMEVSMDIEGISDKELNESTEQLIYRGWITSIIRVWESYRKQIATHGFSQNMEIQKILQTVMGDLNKIRNSFIHGSGIVGEDKECRIKDCEILNWFEPGDKLIFTILHVFDFLHHLGLLQATLTEGTKTSDTNQPDFKLVWLIKKDIILQSIGRKIISVEDSGITKGSPDKRRIRILFDNGLFGVFNPQRFDIKSFQSVQIIRGNLKFDKGTIIKARDIYRLLARNFPPKENWSEEWGFEAKENSKLIFPAADMKIKMSPAKVVEVNIED